MDIHAFQIALALALFFSLPGRAQDNLCMISCTESALSGSGCLLSDISCLCTSAQFKDSYDQCTISNCSFENAQIAQESHAQQCDATLTSSVVSSTTSVQPSTVVTNSASTMSNVPQSSNIFTGSLISSASATPSSLPPPEHHTIPVGTILGSVISTIVLVAIILIVWFRYRRRRHDLRAEEPIARVGSRFYQKDSIAIELEQLHPATTWPYCLPGDPAYDSRISFRPPSVAPDQSPAPMPASNPSSTTALPSQSQSPPTTPPTRREGMTHQPHWLGTHGGTETRLSYPTMSPSPSARAGVRDPRAASQTTERQTQSNGDDR